MNRSALSYPLARGSDADPGGAADLQTDVMRFMAILSLCLVAIFALVQSIPPGEISAVSAAEAPEPPAEIPAAQSVPPAKTVERPPPAESVERPPPARPAAPPPSPAAAPAQPVAPPPAPARAAEPAADPKPLPAPPAPAASKRGFTLRFESDTALTALVAQDKVGLYALRGNDARRLAIERGRLEFWAASVPSRYHEMDAPTVPAAVRGALRLPVDEARDLRWGVTLPASMSSQLNGYLETHEGGELVIGADGRLRLR